MGMDLEGKYDDQQDQKPTAWRLSWTQQVDLTFRIGNQRCRLLPRIARRYFISQ